MNPRITLIGLNHRTADVDVREQFSLAECAAPDTWAIPPDDKVTESLILSTCNRVEILAVSQEDIVDHLFRQWGNACGRKPAEIQRHAYAHIDAGAVRHLFQVAASLDSMVIGEPQILGQLKTAFRIARESGHTSAILNRLLHSAFHTAKRVRTETAIAANAVSVSYAAVELAKRIFGALPGHRALLMGAGEMAELAATHLLHAGIDEIIIANRTYATGEALARKFNGHSVSMDDLTSALQDTDIVIASTGSKEPLLNAQKMKAVLKARKNRPMFLIDIAVPRDIDPEVNALDNIYLYDIDDLRDIVAENLSARREEAGNAELIINEEAARFLDWLESLKAKPTILDIIKRGDAACQAELDRTLRHLGPVSPQVAQALAAMARGIAKRLNHDPIMYLKNQEGRHDTQAEKIAQVRRVLNLDGK